MVKYYSDAITKIRNSLKQLVIYLSLNITSVLLLEGGNDKNKISDVVLVIKPC